MGVLLNFAAHPLASHSPGLGAHQISADYPGEVRKIMEDNSCWCVFADGAAGDDDGLDAGRDYRAGDFGNAEHLDDDEPGILQPQVQLGHVVLAVRVAHHRNLAEEIAG